MPCLIGCFRVNRSRLRSALAAVSCLLAAGASAQQPVAQLPPPPEAATAPAIPESAFAGATAPPRIVRGQDADFAPERIARLQRAVQSDAARLDELKCELEAPGSEFAKAEKDFNHIDAQLADIKKAHQQAMADGDANSVPMLQEMHAEIEKKWTLAKQAFQLALDKRKAQQASIATLETKIAKDKQALDKLRGNTPPAQHIPPTVEHSATAPRLSPVPAEAPVPSAQAAPTPAAAITPLPAPEAPSTVDPANPSAAPAPAAVDSASAKQDKPDEEVVAAQKVAAESEAAARLATEDAASITERLDILRQDIELERKLRAVVSRKIAVARDQLVDLNGQLERKLAAGEPVTEIRRQIRQAENALVAAQGESEQIAQNLDDLQTELATLQSEQVAALQEAEQKQQEAESAQQAVAALNSPFSPRNIVRWLTDHGITIVVILAALAAVLWSGRLLETRLVGLVAMRSVRGNREERENRAKTLVSVLHNAIRTIAFGSAVVMVMDECGIPVGPILGGAAVLGLAVAFGAQSLIKDYFTGFMVLMEQQYMIGDVVQIGEVTAQVERISLRMTVLRDLEGRVHFIPHGQIETVTNLTHEWSRAVFDIGVAYKENVDHVINVLLDVGREIRRDPEFSYMILEDPAMLGVDALGDSAVVIKFTIKTRPLKQWNIKREMLRRIKNRFDELGIEIPFPHRTLYMAQPAAQLQSRQAA